MDTLAPPRAAATASGPAHAAPSPAAADPGVAGRACPNCGTPAPLAYCPACGQAQHTLHRSLRAWAEELLDSFAGWDGKIPRTLGLLVRHPGRLTADYLAGRRARYLPPLRLYLTLSAVFFLALHATPDPKGGGAINVNIGDDATRASPARAAAPARPAPDPAAATWLDRKYKERKRALFAMPAEQRNRAVRDRLTGTMLPNMVFVLLPVFALLVRGLYRGAPLYYAEHVIFALHVHAFFMLAMTAARLVPPKVASAVAVAGMAAYVFVALRRVYGGSRRRTLVKLGLLLSTYGVVLVVAIAVAAVLSLALAA